MNFHLSYTGEPGSIAASLSVDGKPLATTSGLRSKRSARSWARNQAATYKLEQSVDPYTHHKTTKYVSGSQGFSL